MGGGRVAVLRRVVDRTGHYAGFAPELVDLEQLEEGVVLASLEGFLERAERQIIYITRVDEGLARQLLARVCRVELGGAALRAVEQALGARVARRKGVGCGALFLLVKTRESGGGFLRRRVGVEGFFLASAARVEPAERRPREAEEDYPVVLPTPVGLTGVTVATPRQRELYKEFLREFYRALLAAREGGQG
jgi:hypothetical protein